jgi:hypothetical protein
MRLPQSLALILLMSLASFAQSNPTTFTNQPDGFQTGDFVSTIDTEDGQPCSGPQGCWINFQLSSYDLGILLPDFPNVVLTCHIASFTVNPPGFCYTTGCQTVIYTAVANTQAPEDDACTDTNGQAWSVTTTQQRHWVQSGTKISGPVWDGGNGTISAVGKKRKH